MGDQPVGPFFDTSGRRIKDGPAPQRAADVAAAVRAALGVPAEAGRPAAAPTMPRIIVTACFEVYVGSLIQFPGGPGGPAFDLGSNAVIQIQALVDLFTSPYRIVGAHVYGDVCTPIGTAWQVVHGQFGIDDDGQNLIEFSAELGPLSNWPGGVEGVDFTSCAQVFNFGAPYVVPDSYVGIFAYDDVFFHACRILFKGWQACS